jgi:hypothetical protein
MNPCQETSMQTFNSHPESHDIGLRTSFRASGRRDAQAMHARVAKLKGPQQYQGVRQRQRHVAFISGLIAAFSVWST